MKSCIEEQLEGEAAEELEDDNDAHDSEYRKTCQLYIRYRENYYSSKDKQEKRHGTALKYYPAMLNEVFDFEKVATEARVRQMSEQQVLHCQLYVVLLDKSDSWLSQRTGPGVRGDSAASVCREGESYSLIISHISSCSIPQRPQLAN